MTRLSGGTTDSWPATPFPFYRRLALCGWALILVFFVCLGTWAALAPLEYAAIAPGAVISKSRTKSIQHLEGGVIRAIMVHDGDEVKAEQTLLKLDDTKVRAQLATLYAQLWDAKARLARLTAERDEKDDISYPSELLAHRSEGVVADAIQGQDNIFRTFKQLYNSKLDSQRKRVAQIQQQIAGQEAEENAARKQSALIEEQLSGTRFLAEKGLERRTTLLGLERDLAASKGHDNDILAGIGRDRLAIAQAQIDILSLKHDTQSKIADDIRDTETKLLGLSEQVRAATDVLERTAIKAPEDGTITNLQVHTLGGVVSPGQTVLDLVPKDDTLVVEARIRPEDIDRVVAGLDAEVRLLPYNQRRTPPLPAKVIYVSADRLVDKRSDAPYYSVKLQVDRRQLAELSDVKMVPGMPTESMIKTGTTTVALYAFAPLLDTFHKAFHAK